jgi:hypothetical protein
VQVLAWLEASELSVAESEPGLDDAATATPTLLPD